MIEQYLNGFEPTKREDTPTPPVTVRFESASISSAPETRPKSDAEIEKEIDECERCKLGVGSCSISRHTEYVLAKLKGR